MQPLIYIGRETLKYTQEELSGTREHASRLLKEQGNEMADCSTVIGQLTDHMASVLTSLSQKAGIQVRNRLKEQETKMTDFYTVIGQPTDHMILVSESWNPGKKKIEGAGNQDDRLLYCHWSADKSHDLR